MADLVGRTVEVLAVAVGGSVEVGAAVVADV